MCHTHVPIGTRWHTFGTWYAKGARLLMKSDEEIPPYFLRFEDDLERDPPLRVKTKSLDRTFHGHGGGLFTPKYHSKGFPYLRKSAQSFAQKLGLSVRKSSAASRLFSHPKYLTQQQVIVQFTYKKLSVLPAKVAASRLTKMMTYLSRTGAGLGNDRPQWITDKEQVKEKELRSEIRSWAGDKHYFNVVISPEKGAELDLAQYTKEIVSELEKELNTELTWYACAHYDTDNPHVHLLIRGKKKDGKELRIPKNVVCFKFRLLAQEVATKKLGKRKESEVNRALQRAISSPYPTQIDYWIKKYSTDNEYEHNNEIFSDKSTSKREKTERGYVFERLKFLSETGYVYREKRKKFLIPDDFLKKLKERQREADFRKSMHQALGEYVTDELIEFDRRRPSFGKISGIVLARGVLNEQSETPYIIVAAFDGKAYKVPLSTFSERGDDLAKEGHVVTLTVTKVEPVKKADHVLESLRDSKTATYSPQKHLQSLIQAKEGRASFTLGEDTKKRIQKEAKAYVTSIELRAKKLTKIGLISWNKDTGEYFFGPELTKQVEKFYKEKNPYRLNVQVEERGALVELSGEERLTYVDRELVREGAHKSLSKRESEGRASAELEVAKQERIKWLTQKGYSVTSDTVDGIKKYYLSEPSLHKLLLDGLAQTLSDVGRDYKKPAKLLAQSDSFKGLVKGTLFREEGRFCIVENRAGVALCPLSPHAKLPPNGALVSVGAVYGSKNESPDVEHLGRAPRPINIEKERAVEYERSLNKDKGR